jgi:hypothetical protein
MKIRLFFVRVLDKSPTDPIPPLSGRSIQKSKTRGFVGAIFFRGTLQNNVYMQVWINTTKQYVYARYGSSSDCMVQVVPHSVSRQGGPQRSIIIINLLDKPQSAHAMGRGQRDGMGEAFKAVHRLQSSCSRGMFP